MYKGKIVDNLMLFIKNRTKIRSDTRGTHFLDPQK